MNRQILEKFKQLLAPLSIGQKIRLAAITAIAIVGMFFLLVWANQPEYGLLYSNLEPGDAAQIIDDLKGNNMPYKLRDGGTTVLIPSKDIYEMRIKYAGQNLISSGAVGYELFDKNNLGLTEFMQKVNLKRALEGELSKSINQIDAIQQSRVHLVMPEKTLFEDQDTKASASVIVKLKGNGILDRRQIMGITHMIAASVEGLSVEDVTILDSYGKMLTSISSGGEEFGFSNSQLEVKQKIENYLAMKAQTMLDAVLGRDNAIVRVSVALNFDRVTRTTEQYDPDNTAILSEQRDEERTAREDTTFSQSESTVTNYEINKIVEQFVGSVGDIERISVAVFVNGILQDDETYTPRTQDEIDKITEIVKGAVGFNSSRNDEIVVQQLTFDRTLSNREKKVFETIEQKEFKTDMIRIGLITAGALFVFFILRSMLKKVNFDEFIKSQNLQLESPVAGSDQMLSEGTEEIYSEKLSQEAKQRLAAQEKVTTEVTEYIEMDAERAAQILRYWLLEPQNEPG